MVPATFTTPVTRGVLQQWLDFTEIEERVDAALENLGDDQVAWMHFILAYASWNGRFANGVTALASFIGEQKNLFKDAAFPAVVADRSNYVASFVFDAARSEYNDEFERHRDTHRCLGQATVMGTAEFFGIDLNNVHEPQWLHSFNTNVFSGYTGLSALQTMDAQSNPLPGELLHRVFQGIGYHLGTELLADHKFSIIDSCLRARQPMLVQFLENYTISFAGGLHRGYAWIGAHEEATGPGVAGAYDAHFKCALEGVNNAIGYIAPHFIDGCMLAIRQGFLRFSHDHEHFFQRAGKAIE